MNEPQVNIPDELLNEMEIQSVIVSPINWEQGILILSKNMYPNSYNMTVRLYRLFRLTEIDSFSIFYELEAFSFTDYKQASDFIENLPKMSAIDMLLQLSPIPSFS